MPIRRHCNEDFFKQWSPDMAYILGFLFADGTITHNKTGGAYVVLQIADKALLEVIRATLASNHKISRRVHKNGTSTFYRLQIGSRSLVDDLTTLGVCPQKTKHMLPTRVPSAYFGDFVRGYFDGDGNVWTGHIHTNRSKPLFVIQSGFTSCSEIFLRSIEARLRSQNIVGSLYNRPKQNVFRLQYSVKSSILLYRLMYEGMSGRLFLNRKKSRFEVFLSTR